MSWHKTDPSSTGKRSQLQPSRGQRKTSGSGHWENQRESSRPRALHKMNRAPECLHPSLRDPGQHRGWAHPIRFTLLSLGFFEPHTQESMQIDANETLIYAKQPINACPWICQRKKAVSPNLTEITGVEDCPCVGFRPRRTHKAS